MFTNAEKIGAWSLAWPDAKVKMFSAKKSSHFAEEKIILIVYQTN